MRGEALLCLVWWACRLQLESKTRRSAKEMKHIAALKMNLLRRIRICLEWCNKFNSKWVWHEHELIEIKFKRYSNGLVWCSSVRDCNILLKLLKFAWIVQSFAIVHSEENEWIKKWLKWKLEVENGEKWILIGLCCSNHSHFNIIRKQSTRENCYASPTRFVGEYW